MRDPFARRLLSEARSTRPDPSAALQHRIRAGIEAEPAPADGPQPNAWLAVQACAVVALAVVAIILIREPSAPTPEAGTEPPPAMASAPTGESSPPLEELVADLRTELRGMAAALIGLPDWNAAIDVDASLASLTPSPPERP